MNIACFTMRTSYHLKPPRWLAFPTHLSALQRRYVTWDASRHVAMHVIFCALPRLLLDISIGTICYTAASLPNVFYRQIDSPQESSDSTFFAGNTTRLFLGAYSLTELATARLIKSSHTKLFYTRPSHFSLQCTYLAGDQLFVSRSRETCDHSID
jgi:hypothetical protein